MAVQLLRVGQAAGTGATDALFLKQWSGEVLTQFLRKNVTSLRHFMRTIASGKSASFPVTGGMTAFYHTPGANLLESANQPQQGERIISVDDFLVAPVFIPKIDEAKNHYDYRSIYSRNAGNQLAIRLDENVLRCGLRASRGAAVHSQDKAGRQVVSANALTDGAALASAIFDAGVVLDENDCDDEGRTAYMRPAQYALIVKGSDKAIDRDFNGEGNGSYASGKVFQVNNIDLVKTNSFPRTNVTGTPGDKYNVDATKSAALIMHPGAVGTVKLLDLSSEMEYKPEYLATFLNSMYAVGHGELRPDSAVEVRTEALG